jgi:hypothetical protein
LICPFQQSRDVNRFALHAIGDLVPAARSVGDDDRIGALRIAGSSSLRPSASTRRSA